MIFQGEDIAGLPPHVIAGKGLILCPERRRPFREMRVIDNLRAGAFLVRDARKQQELLDNVYALFPRLEERKGQIAGTLSGGEQQMLAIGRSLMSQPKLLAIDEPSTGLAPLIRKDLFARIADIKKMGIAVLLVEQDANVSFRLAERNYILSSGPNRRARYERAPAGRRNRAPRLPGGFEDGKRDREGLETPFSPG